MLVKESFQDVQTPTGSMRVHIVEPNLPQYPHARFPGVVVFSEIYQVTKPVSRFASQIASQGYVCAIPCVFHEFAGEEVIPYDVVGTDRGNDYKAKKLLKAYDDDATATIDLLCALTSCNGRIASTGMCLGGHLAFRAASDSRVLATVCFFATDIHSESLGSPGSSDSLIRAKEIKGELALIFGAQDTHVPLAGRSLIRDTLTSLPNFKNGQGLTFMEVQAQHAFIRDEASKGRFDASLTRWCFETLREIFDRCVVRDLGPRAGTEGEVEHVC